MKYKLLRMAFAVTFLLRCAWPRTSVAQAAIAYSVVAWGLDDSGQTTPPAAALNGVKAIAAGMWHTVAVKEDGSVIAWGALGNSDYGLTTIPLAAQSNVVAIAAGSLHTVALKSDGSVVAWGYNSFGQVTGTPTVLPPQAAIGNPVTLGGQVLSGVTAIAAGSSHTVALRNDGTVVAWGWNGPTEPVAAHSGIVAIAVSEA